MTPDDAATIQAWAAIGQTILGVAIGGATLYFGRMANRLLKLQTEASITPAVTLDLHPSVAGGDEPLNYVMIENHSPLDLHEVTLSAEIFGNKAGCPTDRDPVIRHLGRLPDLGARMKQTWCIDEVMDQAVELMKIGPEDSSPFKGVFTAFARLHLQFRRRSDGAVFEEQLLVGVFKKPGLPRPMAVFTDYRLQIQP